MAPVQDLHSDEIARILREGGGMICKQHQECMPLEPDTDADCTQCVVEELRAQLAEVCTWLCDWDEDIEPGNAPALAKHVQELFKARGYQNHELRAQLAEQSSTIDDRLQEERDRSNRTNRATEVLLRREVESIGEKLAAQDRELEALRPHIAVIAAESDGLYDAFKHRKAMEAFKKHLAAAPEESQPKCYGGTHEDCEEHACEMAALAAAPAEETPRMEDESGTETGIDGS